MDASFQIERWVLQKALKHVAYGHSSFWDVYVFHTVWRVALAAHTANNIVFAVSVFYPFDARPVDGVLL
jgi:hypothetical protein